MNKRTTETLKNIAILCLSISACLLMSQMEIFSRVSSLLLEEEVYSLEEVDWQGEEQLSALSPHAMVAVRQQEQGTEQLGLQYQEGISELFAYSSQILKEAMGNFSQVEEITQEEFCSALSTAPSLYYQWLQPVPLYLLELYLSNGSTAENTSYVQVILLSPWKDSMALFYQEQNRFYVAPVDAIEEQRLESVLEHFFGSPKEFAFQQEELSNLHPLTILEQGSLEKTMYQTSSLSDMGFDSLLDTLGFPSNSKYSVSDGTVFRGSSDSLRLSQEGQITYQGEEGSRYNLPKESLHITLLEQIEGCRRFALQVLEHLNSPLELQVSHISLDAEAVYLEFSATLEGVPLAFGDSLVAGSFSLYQEEIRSFSLWHRNYQPSEGKTPLLPAAQASSILPHYGSQELLLVYQDSGSDWVSATWVSP